MSTYEGDMITLNEFLYLYHRYLLPIIGILSFCLGIENLGSSLGFLLLFVIGNHDIFHLWNWWETMFDDLWGEVPRLLRKWKSQHWVRIFFFNHFSWLLHLTLTYITLLLLWSCSFWSSWIGESTPWASPSYPCFCPRNWGFWWYGRSSSLVWLLSWTWAFWVRVRKDSSRGKK